MIATVFHAKNTRDSFDYETNGDFYNREMALADYNGNGYQMVGQFNVTDDSMNTLEQVYVSTQNINTNWSKGAPQRSTSVGDIVEIGGKLWIVASFGFEAL